MMEKEIDCAFSSRQGWFRYRACAIIIEGGEVLVAKNDSVNYFYSVGGGVHLHETAEQAVIREVHEETGYFYDIDRLAFIHENFFHANITKDDQDCHEIAFYFIMKPKGIKEFKHKSYALNNVREYMVWLPIDKLHEYEVYPSFFKDKLKSLPQDLEHIVTNSSKDPNQKMLRRVNGK